LTEESKNLDSTTETKTVAEESGKPNRTVNAQLITGRLVEFEFWMQKQNYAPATIETNRKVLRILSDRKADLLNSESVKETIAKQKWSENRKRIAINAYSLFLKLNGQQWDKPKCHVNRKFPFIPTEQEIDALVSGSGKKTATFLQLLKITAMRCGEAKRLEWINIDFEKNIVTLNLPEKNSEPRMWKVDPKLISMLNAAPKVSPKVFGESSLASMKTTFQKTRKRLAAKLQNPRLLKISFHTYRHWKATMLYHRTHDVYYVKQFLGHKSLKNTEIYINIERTFFEDQSDEFSVKVAEKPEEVKSLLELGFEYVCQKDGLIFLRKRK
jgi:integrase